MCADLLRSLGHVFYDRLQSVLIKGGFDRFVEKLCEPYYASGLGRKSIPLGRYFKMHSVGYFEGIESERGLEWRCYDSLSLQKFRRLSLTQRVQDHSSLSRIRQRLPLEVHPEHAVDMDTGAIVSADIHKAGQGDTTTIGKTLESARKNLSDVGCTPITMAPTEVIADKGFHSRGIVKELDGRVWMTRIAESKASGLFNWKGDHKTRRAVYNNRALTKSSKGRELATRRTALVAFDFA